MAVWFEGSETIQCQIEQVKDAVADVGAHFAAVVKQMPGLTSVDVIDSGTDFVVIRTNEGTMTRRNIVRTVEANRVLLEYDEVYEAGSATTVGTHFVDEYVSDGERVSFHLVMSGVQASGVLGFLYRHLGKSSIGKAVLNAHRACLEAAP